MSFTVLFSTFANNILPIILLSSAGFALGKILHVDARGLGRIVFYVFSPVLIFDLMLKNRLDLKDAALTIAFTVSCILAMGILTYIIGRILKFERRA